MADENFQSMQEEAVRRVKEMQRRSQSYTSPPPDTDNLPPEPAPETKSKQTEKPLFNIAGIKIDEEKALIILLIYILYKNKADMKLILGLGYLLL